MRTTRFRAVIAFILVLLTAFCINTTSSYAAKSKTKAPTYTPAQIQQIQLYVPAVTQLQSRLGELEKMIDAEQWVDIRDFIHGPFGEFRARIGRIERNLKGIDQVNAQKLSDEVLEHLIGIDVSAEKQDYEAVVKNYNAFVKDLDALLDLVPQSA
jgi:photosystem II protein PsbQ